ncbi:MAG: nuclear transport factor 2 family protein [Maribacter sp.]|uniref:YybH family protein n=1 Tax=Maribacter sp. TaxID=1897614 RepID=UPI003298653C
MQAKLTITALIIGVSCISGCKSDDPKKTFETVPIDLITTEFPEAKQEVVETWDAIVQSLRAGDIDQLIEFHGYSPKFTEYTNGEAVKNAEANEAYERAAFGAVTEVVKFDTEDFKVAVYGEVANVTFQSDFHLKFGQDLAIINEQISLLFVRTTDGWKIVHEHHSPWIL